MNELTDWTHTRIVSFTVLNLSFIMYQEDQEDQEVQDF